MANVKTEQWQTVGWDGVTLRVPPDWNIGAIGGDRQQGYLRLDSAEMPRVEIKWHNSKGFADVSGVVDRYLKDLTKKRKRGDPPVEVDRDCSVVSKRQMRKKALTCFAWRADTEGYGAAWYCEKCERVVVAQVMALPNEDGEGLAREVIGELSDHPRGGWVTWATYGLSMQAPERFLLAGQKLMAGLIDLKLASEGEEIVAGRWGMANVALRNRTLEDWASAEATERHKGVRIRCEETEFRGHPAVSISGEFRSPIRRLQAFAMHCVRKPYPEVVKGLAWHCESENKLHYVGALVDEGNLELCDELAERMACHEGTGAEGDDAQMRGKGS